MSFLIITAIVVIVTVVIIIIINAKIIERYHKKHDRGTLQNRSDSYMSAAHRVSHRRML